MAGRARTDFVFFVIRELEWGGGGGGWNYRGRVAISPIYVLSLSLSPPCLNIFFLLPRLRKLTAPFWSWLSLQVGWNNRGHGGWIFAALRIFFARDGECFPVRFGNWSFRYFHGLRWIRHDVRPSANLYAPPGTCSPKFACTELALEMNNNRDRTSYVSRVWILHLDLRLNFKNPRQRTHSRIIAIQVFLQAIHSNIVK